MSVAPTTARAQDLALADRILAAIKTAQFRPDIHTWTEVLTDCNLQCWVYGFERAKLDGPFSTLSHEPADLRWFRAKAIARQDWSDAWARLNAALLDLEHDQSPTKVGGPAECWDVDAPGMEWSPPRPTAAQATAKALADRALVARQFLIASIVDDR